MTAPTIITVAITGSLPRKENNPAVPITPEEQIESTHEAFEAGATVAMAQGPDDNLYQLVYTGSLVRIGPAGSTPI